MKNKRKKRVKKHGVPKALKAKAIQLLQDRRFLFLASKKVSELGLVGEQRVVLLLLLAAIARVFPEPPSILIVGPTSCGKSTVIKFTLQLFPPEAIVERAGLSAKALAHGKWKLANKILFIHEYRGGRDARLLLRLLQSEGGIRYEYTA
jgi:hypothetical protein